MSSSLSGNATSQTFCSLYVTRSTKKTEKVTQTSRVLYICQPTVGILVGAKTVARKVVFLFSLRSWRKRKYTVRVKSVSRGSSTREGALFLACAPGNLVSQNYSSLQTIIFIFLNF